MKRERRRGIRHAKIQRSNTLCRIKRKIGKPHSILRILELPNRTGLILERISMAQEAPPTIPVLPPVFLHPTIPPTEPVPEPPIPPPGFPPITRR